MLNRVEFDELYKFLISYISLLLIMRQISQGLIYETLGSIKGWWSEEGGLKVLP